MSKIHSFRNKFLSFLLFQRKLESRNSFLATVHPLQHTAEHERLELWMEKHKDQADQPVAAKESLSPGADEDRRAWQTLNRFRAGVGRTKFAQRQWGYIPADSDISCECGQGEETVDHLRQCGLSGGAVEKEDFALYNDKARCCVVRW